MISFKKNDIIDDFTKLRVRFIALNKFGKNALIEGLNKVINPERDTIAIISLKGEKGSAFLDVTTKQVSTFLDLEETIDEIVDNADMYREKGIKMFVFDTEDEFIKITDANSIKVSNRERKEGSKMAKSVNSAFGGFSKGIKHSIETCQDLLDRVYSAGFGYITFGHSKPKDIVDKKSETTFEQVTSNLDSRYNSGFNSYADLTMIGYFEYETEGEIKNNRKESKAVIINNVIRKISLNSTNINTFGSGCRFHGMPSEIEFKNYPKPKDINNITKRDVFEQQKTNVDNAMLLYKTISNALEMNKSIKNGDEIKDYVNSIKEDSKSQDDKSKNVEEVKKTTSVKENIEEGKIEEEDNKEKKIANKVATKFGELSIEDKKRVFKFLEIKKKAEFKSLLVSDLKKCVNAMKSLKE